MSELLRLALTHPEATALLVAVVALALTVRHVLICRAHLHETELDHVLQRLHALDNKGCDRVTPERRRRRLWKLGL